MKIASETQARRARIKLMGELDISSVEDFKRSVDQESRGCEIIEIDFKELEFLDSTGIGGLVQVIKSFLAQNKQVYVVNVPVEIYEVLELLGIPDLVGKEVFRK